MDNNKKKITFICPNCKTKEDFDYSFVDNIDRHDNGDDRYPPRFSCLNCNGLMEPVYYKNYKGIVYAYKEK